MIGFQRYLEAKAAVDTRAMDQRAFTLFIRHLSKLGQARVLEIGCGTGAMIRRVLRTRPPVNLEITAYDLDSESLGVAREQIALLLDDAQANSTSDTLAGRQAGNHLCRVSFHRGDVLRDPLPPGRYDAIMAHALLDVLPIGAVLTRLEEHCLAGSLLYSAINYDGRTLLYPAASDPSFEQDLLHRYDLSMDARRVDGAATGGSRCGEKLIGELARRNYELLAVGPSDWHVRPSAGPRESGDFLSALLAMMRDEGERQGADSRRLEAWYTERATQARRASLGLIVHQIDILAQYEGR
jgi:SAM-dependent methyltransferase